MTPVARLGRAVFTSVSHGRELALEVGPIVEAAAREEAPLHPAHELLDGAFLLGRPRPAQFRSEAIVEGDLAEDGVPDDQGALPSLHDRLGIVPDRDQGDALEGLEAAEQGAHHGFLLLIRHHAHVDGATPLQAAGEEMDPPGAAVDVADIALAEVVLTELARDPLEAHDGYRRHRSQPSD
jgi:hypothetical protein